MKMTIGALSAILLAGCAQFAEMDEARETGKVYLTGRFEEQICELEAFATAHPELNYTAERIVKEVVPSAKKDEVSFEFRTKYEAPNSKIRLYGKKVKFPITRDGVNAWIGTIDGNIAQLNGKMVATVEDARRKEEERIAEAKRLEEERQRKEEERIAEAKRLEEERQRKEEARIAMENAAAEEARLREEARVLEAARLVAEMPESERFPLLSVQPHPQMLMKGVSSGSSIKWVQGWLLANKIKHEDPKDLFDGSRVMIMAYFYDEANKLNRMVRFLFFGGALVEVKIIPRDFTVTVDVAKDKYLQQFGTAAKVDEQEEACNGKIWHSDFSRKGFPVDGEGVVAIYTDNLLAGINYYKTDDKWCDKILLTDRVLSKYAEETIQRKKEAEAKAAEDAKKAKAAAALDF